MEVLAETERQVEKATTERMPRVGWRAAMADRVAMAAMAEPGQAAQMVDVADSSSCTWMHVTRTY